MFDSPLHFCTVCRAYVALDESPQECAARHHCNVEHCPIAVLFTLQRAEATATPVAERPQTSRPGPATPPRAT